ncbi:MAG: dihydroorotase [Albidovulum sp.]|nr:dihydroorotase [Albidovulum sp.]
MIILANAMIVDPESESVNPGSVIVENGRIADRDGPELESLRYKTVNCGGKFLAPGIVDIGVKVCEPGERHKESYRSAGLAAAAGGVTTMVTRPDTIPAIDNPETLEFVSKRARAASPVRIKTIAALTKNRSGRQMTEIGLLQDAGAVAFSDCDSVVEDTKIFSRCLQYAKQRDALVIGHPQDPGLSAGASATSGKFASLKGIPAVSRRAELIGLQRDVELAALTGARYHADQLSTSLSIEYFERAAAAGLDVSAGASIHHLTLNEFDIGDYRTFFKVKPPLRSEDDRKALVEAVASGSVEVISSMHTPQDEEAKRLPFEEAASGAVALETLLPAALRLFHSGDITLPRLFRALSLNPSKLLGFDTGRISKGAPADFVLFDPDAPFVLDRFGLRSKSQNTPFDGQLLQGRILKTFVDGEPVYGSGA